LARVSEILDIRQSASARTHLTWGAHLQLLCITSIFNLSLFVASSSVH